MAELSFLEDFSHLAGRQPAGLPIGAGDWFPDLFLPSVETTEPLRLADLRGGPLLLHVFASW